MAYTLTRLLTSQAGGSYKTWANQFYLHTLYFSAFVNVEGVDMTIVMIL